jgi:hypothetical protein
LKPLKRKSVAEIRIPSELELKFRKMLNKVFLSQYPDISPLQVATDLSSTYINSIITMPKVYLLSRTLDPLLGVFTGLLAYYLHETNPRSAPMEGHRLHELVAWKWGVAKEARAAGATGAAGGVADGADGVDWEKLRKELEVDGKK